MLYGFRRLEIRQGWMGTCTRTGTAQPRFNLWDSQPLYVQGTPLEDGEEVCTRFWRVYYEHRSQKQTYFNEAIYTYHGKLPPGYIKYKGQPS
jgi:hypothetical protein